MSGRGIAISKSNALAALVLSCTLASAGWCQRGGIDAEFAGAGARPLAMGGAFLALADDSTAAEFNPAGVAGPTKTRIGLASDKNVRQEGRVLPDFARPKGRYQPVDHSILYQLCASGARNHLGDFPAHNHRFHPSLYGHG